MQKSKTKTFRLDSKEIEIIKRNAAELGISEGAWLRMLIRCNDGKPLTLKKKGVK
jgi:predicted DNA binding CopG/RHH family protein